MKILLSFIASAFIIISINAQTKFDHRVVPSLYSSTDNNVRLNLNGLYNPHKSIPHLTPFKTYFNTNRNFRGAGIALQPSLILKNIKEEGSSVWVEVLPSSKIRKLKSRTAQVYSLLEELKGNFLIDNPQESLKITAQHTDNQGNEHIRLNQQYNGIPVYGGELMAHTHDGVIDIINGHIVKINPIKTTPTITKKQVEEIVLTLAAAQPIKTHLLKYTGGAQINSTLIIYPMDDQIVLAYQVSVFPNLSERWEYIIDANSGELIDKHLNSCKLHNHKKSQTPSTSNYNGPTSASEGDLSGQNVNINVYEEGGIFYLLNVNEKMFNPSLSKLPNEPVGGILTLNAKNTSPETEAFNVDHIATNNNRWDAPIAVTAHSNATKAYRYFEETFNRVSYDNKGGSILSFINVADSDGAGMDNAFWNGFALFYGNGKQTFARPLAAALDVAAHELSHGVVQHTANLTYKGESGALNESFADVFGVLIEREDWSIGEDVVNTGIFPSGALRSLSDPHNGGSSLNDLGYQPKNVAEQFHGRQDNGGVHINSGIPNHAFYLFANNSDVGIVRAEQVYYKALRDYLVASSNFVSLRRAVGQSIVDIYGNDQSILNAYNAAFDGVGIGSSTDTTAEEPEITEFEFNSGDDFVMWYKKATSEIMLRTITNEVDASISTLGLTNIPSISDDGRIMLFIGSDKKMYAVLFDWEQGTKEELLISDTREWRNVAISKDGTKIAAVSGNLATDEFDNQILIVDLVSETQRWYPLTNPTTASGVSTGDVRYADALEWDHTSQFVMYDASNEIKSLFNDPISYWDIGFLKAWDNETNNYGDGNISKLFPNLPENVSIGNPTFTKASPDIIALDLLDSREGDTKYSIIGVNLETSDQGLLFENNTVGYPRYSTRDDLVIFNIKQTSGDIIGVIETRPDRINSPGEGFVLVPDARWGVWFSNGTRDLSTGIGEIVFDDQLSVFPNPVSTVLNLDTHDITCRPCQVKIYDIRGVLKLEKAYKTNESIDLSILTSGLHFLTLQDDIKIRGVQFVKH